MSQQLIELYRTMSLLRAAELRALRAVHEDEFGGLWHSGIGHEAIAAGIGGALRSDDRIFGSHRGMVHALAKGMTLSAIFGDLLFRTTGSARGKGAGTPHFADSEVGVMGLSGTLGGSFVLGAGTAMGDRMLGRDAVTVVVFGDGTSARGTFYEALLSASAWKLPVVFVCENNRWGVSAAFERQSPTKTVAERSSAFAIKGEVVDGGDVLAVQCAVASAVESARMGDGPTLLEMQTVRMRGHWEGDQQKYRDDEVVLLNSDQDPVARTRSKISEHEASEIDQETEALVERAFNEALAAPKPGREIVAEDVWV